MNDKQKVIFKQLQLAGLGIVLMIFGFFAKHMPILIIGICVLVFGLIRTWIMKKLVDHMEEDE